MSSSILWHPHNCRRGYCEQNDSRSSDILSEKLWIWGIEWWKEAEAKSSECWISRSCMRVVRIEDIGRSEERRYGLKMRVGIHAQARFSFRSPEKNIHSYLLRSRIWIFSMCSLISVLIMTCENSQSARLMRQPFISYLPRVKNWILSILPRIRFISAWHGQGDMAFLESARFNHAAQLSPIPRKFFSLPAASDTLRVSSEPDQTLESCPDSTAEFPNRSYRLPTDDESKSGLVTLMKSGSLSQFSVATEHLVLMIKSIPLPVLHISMHANGTRSWNPQSHLTPIPPVLLSSAKLVS